MLHMFIITIEATIPQTNIRDLLNLQECIENAFYPPTNAEQVKLQNSLINIVNQGSGVTTGQAQFIGPMYDDNLPKRMDNNFSPVGHIQIEVRSTARTIMRVNIIPMNDSREHQQSETCFCQPRKSFESDRVLIIHNAQDLREVYEQITGEPLEGKQWICIYER